MLGASFSEWHASAVHSASIATHLDRVTEARRRDSLAVMLHTWQAQASRRAAKRAVLTFARRRVGRVRCGAPFAPLCGSFSTVYNAQ